MPFPIFPGSSTDRQVVLENLYSSCPARPGTRAPLVGPPPEMFPASDEAIDDHWAAKCDARESETHRVLTWKRPAPDSAPAQLVERSARIDLDQEASAPVIVARRLVVTGILELEDGKEEVIFL